MRRVWQALLDAVREQSRTIQALLSNATASAVEGNTLVLTLPNAPLARRLGEERNAEVIKRALNTVLGVDWQLRCEHVSADASFPGTPKQTPRNRRPAAPQPQTEPEPPAPANAAPPVDDDEAMLAETAGMSREHPSRRDPEEVALALLAEELGARRIDP